MKNLALSLIISMFVTQVLFSQNKLIVQQPDQTNRLSIIKATHKDMNTKVPPPEEFITGKNRTATFNVTYNGFTPEAMVAFQYAVDIWASLLTSSQVITVEANWQPLPQDILGGASPGEAIELSNSFYPIALAEAITNQNLNNLSNFDIVATFNSDLSNWYYGTDMNTPSGEFDFVSVVLHELGHGIGFSGTMKVDTFGIGSWGSGSAYPAIYDRFAENGFGEQLVDINVFPNNSMILADQLTGNNLFFNGPEASLANGGTPPKIHAPDPWEPGSSFTHLDETTFPPGDPNSLMTPGIGQSEAIHSPGPVSLGMLYDMGWYPLFTQIITGAVVNDGGPSYGAAWGDYDNDGFIDLFVANLPGGAQNFLYHNNGDGTFTKITTGQIVTDISYSTGGTWGDYDGDNFLDLCVFNNGGRNFLYQNNGDGTFNRVNTAGRLTTDWAYSLGGGWADYDNDGHLDVYVANLPLNNVSGFNFLYHNSGNETFERITGDDTVIDDAESMGVVWGDYDNDGALDLFVANRGINNALFHNNGDGSFTKNTSSIISNEGGSSSGGSWGDYDNDGDLDLFVTNDGHQAELQNYFFSLKEDDYDRYITSDAYNTSDLDNYFYENNGNGTFTKITNVDIVSDSRTCYSSNWGDYDNDGDLDLFVGTLNSVDNYLLYQNNGDKTFSKIMTANINSLVQFPGGSVWGDYDNDGDLDLLICNSNGNNLLFQNNHSFNNWIKIKCLGSISNTFGYGAKVKVKTTINGQNVWQLRQIGGQSNGGWIGGYNSLEAHFGLGNTTVIDSIKIEWPSGIIQVLEQVSVNTLLVVEEDTSVVAIAVNGANLPSEFSLAQNYPNPFNPSTTISYSLPKSSRVILKIYNLLGQEVKTLKNEYQLPGLKSAVWNGRDNSDRLISSGVYIYSIQVGNKKRSKKMVIVR